MRAGVCNGTTVAGSTESDISSPLTAAPHTIFPWIVCAGKEQMTTGTMTAVMSALCIFFQRIINTSTAYFDVLALSTVASGHAKWE
jgi:hypothetical protein